VPVTRPVEHGDTLTVGGQTLEVVHLRGHTPGSIALVWRGGEGAGTHLFTGDSLFPGGHGKTATREHHDALMDDLEHKVFGRFDDDTWVYPGHGDDTTLGAERPSLPEWRERGW
jgi:glyoxylase-like metal-dependent hydrolase (beta-lactamase superfamily II)